MPSQPKKDAIAEAAVTALKGVLRGAGYWNDFKAESVTRRRWNELTVNQSRLPVASVWVGDGEPSPVACIGSYKERFFLVVEVWVRSQDAKDLDRDCLRAEADVKQALLTNPSLGLTGIALAPSKNVADHQEFADLNMGSKAVGFQVDYNWTAAAP